MNGLPKFTATSATTPGPRPPRIHRGRAKAILIGAAVAMFVGFTLHVGLRIANSMDRGYPFGEAVGRLFTPQVWLGTGELGAGGILFGVVMWGTVGAGLTALFIQLAHAQRPRS
jgi:hypothetical protein